MAGHGSRIIVASDADYEYLIAEIYYNDDFIDLLQQEEGEENIKIEFAENIKPIDYEWFKNALIKAKKDLLNE